MSSPPVASMLAISRPGSLNLLARLSKDGRTVRDVAPPRGEKFATLDTGDFDYIEISDVCSDGTATSSRLPQSEAPSRATWHVHAGDVLTSTVRPIRACPRSSRRSRKDSSARLDLSSSPQEVASEVLLTYCASRSSAS